MIPAAARTWRCLVTPCLVIEKSSASREIDAGPPSDNWRSSVSRVGSPSAANSSAALARLLSALRFGIFLNPDDDLGPALDVVLEDLGAAGERDVVEPGLRYAQPRAGARRFQREGDRRPRLAGVVDGGIHGARVPLPGEPARRRHLR